MRLSPDISANLETLARVSKRVLYSLMNISFDRQITLPCAVNAINAEGAYLCRREEIPSALLSEGAAKSREAEGANRVTELRELTKATSVRSFPDGARRKFAGREENYTLEIPDVNTRSMQGMDGLRLCVFLNLFFSHFFISSFCILLIIGYNWCQLRGRVSFSEFYNEVSYCLHFVRNTRVLSFLC